MISDTKIKSFVEGLTKQEHLISENRKEVLAELSSAIRADLDKNGEVKVVFVCTHNSRRSQLGQVLLKVIAAHYGVENIHTFSGGTEATAFNHRMVTALQNAGFILETKSNGHNPEYEFKVSESEEQGDILFSKIYHHPYNPQRKFTAVMVCSEADEGCPLVIGATSRISLPYQDPKDFDDTPQEEKAYADKVLEIGRELVFVVKQLVN